jgi:hypothetical protein
VASYPTREINACVAAAKKERDGPTKEGCAALNIAASSSHPSRRPSSTRPTPTNQVSEADESHMLRDASLQELDELSLDASMMTESGRAVEQGEFKRKRSDALSAQSSPEASPEQSECDGMLDSSMFADMRVKPPEYWYEVLSVEAAFTKKNVSKQLTHAFACVSHPVMPSGRTPPPHPN